MVDPKHVDVKAAVARLSREFLETSRGAHERGPYYAGLLSGEFEWESGEPNPKVRSAVHTGDDGEIDGVLVYEINRDDDTIEVEDLMAANPTAEVALWNYLGRHELCTKVTAHCVDPDGPLRWVLADPRRLKTTRVSDHAWLRVLDVAEALRIRGWEQRGSACLEVVDPLGLSAGTWTVTVGADGVEVAEGGDDPAMLDVATLGSLYFGDVRVRRLADVGLVTGSDEAVNRLDALFAVQRRPLNKAHW